MVFCCYFKAKKLLNQLTVISIGNITSHNGRHLIISSSSSSRNRKPRRRRNNISRGRSHIHRPGIHHVRISRHHRVIHSMLIIRIIHRTVVYIWITRIRWKSRCRRPLILIICREAVLLMVLMMMIIIIVMMTVMIRPLIMIVLIVVSTPFNDKALKFL
jgi:hypothetical protein